ncbi:hypothetical protein D3C85_1279430 [compost metagenome]
MDAELDSKAPASPHKTAIRQARYLLTTPTGPKLWRLKLYLQHREKTLAAGAFHAVTLAQAIQARNDARTTRAGIPPSATHKAEHTTLRPRAKVFRLVMTREDPLAIETPRQILNLTPKQTAAGRALLLAVEPEGTRHAAD